jgi:hypothetical protein
MPPREAPPPIVTFGARSMAALDWAYAAAVRRRAGGVSTLDVLTRVALHEKSTPPWLFEGARQRLLRIAARPHEFPSERTVGELVAAPATGFDAEVRATLREVEWRVRRRAGRWGYVRTSDVEPWINRPQWTNAVHAMLGGALAVAHDKGVSFASPTHLMLAMLRLPSCDGTRYVFTYENARKIAVEWLSKEPDLRRADQPHPDVEWVKAALWPRSGPLPGRPLRWLLSLGVRLSRIGPLLLEAEAEARRQAVRLGHRVVGPAHTLLAMLAVDARLDAAGIAMPAYHASRNRGASILRHCGVDVTRLRDLAACRGEPEEPAAEVLATQMDRLRPGDSFHGAEVVAAVMRAKDISLARRHADTGTSHLLLALIEDDAGEAAAVLRALGVDPATVRERVEQDLGAAPAA